ncbi:hypothetical protein [Flavobacterium kingsejongi]|nr:hypothetical protein [Flavobacterium kingsejongi]
MCVLLVSCNKDVKPEAIAKANDSYLYKEDVEHLVPTGTSKEDSLVIVKNFIDKWATQKLLIDAAEMNLSDEKIIEFDNLIKQYKIDLYTKAYIEEVVKERVDTAVSPKELKDYYDANKENFKANTTLIKLRYINLPKDHPKFETIKNKLFNLGKGDRKLLDSYAVQYKGYALNDSVWVEMNQVYRKLPFITPENRGNYIIPGKSIQQQDSLNVYLVKIVKVLDKNQISPFEYIKPTLRQIVLNKRKLELIKKIEKEITDDAIKNDKYEIYNK